MTQAPSPPPAPPGGQTGVTFGSGGYGSTGSTGSGGPSTSAPTQLNTAQPLDPSLASQMFTVTGRSGSDPLAQARAQLGVLYYLYGQKDPSGAPVDQAELSKVLGAAKAPINVLNFLPGNMPPKVRQRLQQAATQTLRDTLQAQGIDASRAVNPAQFSQLGVSASTRNGLQGQGYKIDASAQTLGTLMGSLASQGGVQTSEQISGQEIWNQFTSAIANPAQASQLATEFSAAGLADTNINPQDQAGLANAFQKAMKEAGGQNPWDYVSGKVGDLTAKGLQPNQKPDSPYGYVQGLANTIWGAGVLSDNDINAIVRDFPQAGQSNVDDIAVKQAVARAGALNYHYDPNKLPGVGSYLASVVDNLQTTLGQFALSESPDQMTALMDSTIKDVLKEGDLTSIYSATDAAIAAGDLHGRQLASQLYPALAPLVKQGYTTQQVLDPYKTAAANILGTSPDAINLTDPEWAGILKNPDGVLPSMDQMRAIVMQDPKFNWADSQDARTKYSSMAQTLVSTWGKVGGGPVPYSNSVPSPTAA